MELKEKVSDKKNEIRKDIDEMLSHIPEIKESISDSIEEAGEGLKKAYGKMMQGFK
jgi:gas vesicle protein